MYQWRSDISLLWVRWATKKEQEKDYKKLSALNLKFNDYFKLLLPLSKYLTLFSETSISINLNETTVKSDIIEQIISSMFVALRLRDWSCFRFGLVMKLLNSFISIKEFAKFSTVKFLRQSMYLKLLKNLACSSQDFSLSN